jgi:hypothetical protein
MLPPFFFLVAPAFARNLIHDTARAFPNSWFGKGQPSSRHAAMIAGASTIKRDTAVFFSWSPEQRRYIVRWKTGLGLSSMRSPIRRLAGESQFASGVGHLSSSL